MARQIVIGETSDNGTVGLKKTNTRWKIGR